MNIKRFSDKAVVPKYAKPGDSGFDLVATEDVLIGPGETGKVPTGWGFEIPDDEEIQVRLRSGVTSNTKLRVQFGTIDAGYIGEVGVTIDNIAFPTIIGFNHTGVQLDCTLYPRDIEGNFIEEEALMGTYVEPTYLIRRGDRAAQGVRAKVVRDEEGEGFNEVDELRETERGVNGFGSTGVSVE